MPSHQDHMLTSVRARVAFLAPVVIEDDGCWTRTRQVGLGAHRLSTRRVAYATWRGFFNEWDRIIPICGNPQCVNPIHLVREENDPPLLKKGTEPTTLPTREEAREFIERGFTVDDLADLFASDIDTITTLLS